MDAASADTPAGVSAGAITATLRFRRGASLLLDAGPEGLREVVEQPYFPG
jgi:hypothetical protein